MLANNENAGDLELLRDSDGLLAFVDEHGVRHAAVEPVRGFPISDPDHWISICDSQGREVASIADLDALRSETRALLEEELARREFVPQIRAILNVPADTDPTEWEIETDRGRTRFLLNSADDVRRLGPHRALVIDSLGIRYLIDDARQLDAPSQHVLEHYLPTAGGKREAP